MHGKAAAQDLRQSKYVVQEILARATLRPAGAWFCGEPPSDDKHWAITACGIPVPHTICLEPVSMDKRSVITMCPLIPGPLGCDILMYISLSPRLTQREPSWYDQLCGIHGGWAAIAPCIGQNIHCLGGLTFMASGGHPKHLSCRGVPVRDHGRGAAVRRA
jgi:hypothetical protein